MTNSRWQQQKRFRAASLPNGLVGPRTSIGEISALSPGTLLHRNDSKNEIHAVFFAMFHHGAGTETLSVVFGPEATPFTWNDAQPINSALAERFFFLMPGDILSAFSTNQTTWRLHLSVVKYKMAS